MNNIGYSLEEKYSINELILDIEKIFNTHRVLSISCKFNSEKNEKLFNNKINAFWLISNRSIKIDSDVKYRESLSEQHRPDVDKLLINHIYSKSYNKNYFNKIYSLFEKGINIESRFETYKELLEKYNFKENEIDDFLNYLQVKHDEIKKSKKELNKNKVLSPFRKNSNICYEIEDIQLRWNKDSSNLEKWKRDAIVFTELFMKYGLKSISSNNQTLIELIENNDIQFVGLSPSLFKFDFDKNLSSDKKGKINKILTGLIQDESYFFQSLISMWRKKIHYGSIYSGKSFVPKKMKITKNLLNFYIQAKDFDELNVALSTFSAHNKIEIKEHKIMLKDLIQKIKDYNWLQEEIETNPKGSEKLLSSQTKKRRM